MMHLRHPVWKHEHSIAPATREELEEILKGWDGRTEKLIDVSKNQARKNLHS
jgi:hypothetical protein